MNSLVQAEQLKLEIDISGHCSLAPQQISLVAQQVNILGLNEANNGVGFFIKATELASCYC